MSEKVLNNNTNSTNNHDDGAADNYHFYHHRRPPPCCITGIERLLRKEGKKTKRHLKRRGIKDCKEVAHRYFLNNWF